MKLNDATRDVLIRSKLGWVLEYLSPEHEGKEVKVQLIDLDVLSLRTPGFEIPSGYHISGSLLFFGREGVLLGEVGRKEEIKEVVIRPSRSFPYLKMVTQSHTELSPETVEQALKRMPTIAPKLRFIVEINKGGSRGANKVNIYKLRNSDADLLSRLEEIKMKEIEEIKKILDS